MQPAPSPLLPWDTFTLTDKGTQFTSDEFKKFLRENDILHTLTAPGHPAANRLAESYVGEFIQG